MAFLFTRLVRYVIFAIVLYSVVQYVLRWKSYSISPKIFRQACAAAHGSNGISNVNKLRNDLRRSYPLQIIDSDWEAIYGGGLNLQSNILYASVTEFVIVFRAPYRTVGFAGWHWINSTCTVLNGEVVRSAYSAHGGNLEKFEPGQNFRHGEFERYTYEFAPDSYMACYGRGAVFLSTAWVGMGSLTNGDPISFAKLLYIYNNACIHQIKQSLVKTFNYYKSKALKTEL
uniref:Sigma non-opioid intracellular receptor 1 n=1 Tax=Elaeophora elaphi TaxID=1147741 RepID=A0A0R3S399_9BILA